MKIHVLLALASALGLTAVASEFPEWSAPRAITQGPHEHFLASYFAIDAWSPDHRYVAVLETDVNGRLPEVDERCTVGVVDTEDGNRFVPVTTTACWNFQEAAMFHWLNDGEFLFNDVRDGRFVTVVMNLKTRAERILPRPVSAVSADGAWAVSVNYARLSLTRPDYGYAGNGQNPLADVTWPADDGLWVMDLKTGESRLILSVSDARREMPPVASVAGKPGNPLAYFCHTVISKDGKKIFFLARSVDWFDRETHKIPAWQTTSLTIDRDGKNLRRCFKDGWAGSHFNWAPDGSHRMLVTAIWDGEKKEKGWSDSAWSLVEFTVGKEEKVRRIGAGILDQDWHCIYSPDGKFASGETYWDKNFNRPWVQVRLSDGLVKPEGAFFVPEKYRGTYWRCDLHARYRSDGRQLAFNSVHEGTRQVYVRDVGGPDRSHVRTVRMLDGEHWWGVANYFGTKMPFASGTSLAINLRRENHSNQTASMLLSDRGRAIWSDAQACFRFANGVITVDADAPVELTTAATPTLAGAYREMMSRHFRPAGEMPPELFFTAPQLNTWIELTYHQNERDILAYAQAMLDHGIPPGVLMIDDTWQAGYGDWRFEPTRFADPKGMMDRLHGLGYRVMLWMCPYVGMDTPAFRRLAWGTNPDDVRGYPTKGGFLTVPDGSEPKACRWWNGYSAFLDFSHPNANAWFAETLDGLVKDYGVDGFKFDGGDFYAYSLDDRRASDPSATNGSLNQGYAAYARKYPYCEIRNVWRNQQIPVVLRLHDKPHRWEALRSIVADMLAAGLLGYPYICPDMVGGGEWTNFLPGSRFDAELFIRSAQIHALSPMMQISASPWRVLKPDEQRIFSAAVALRQKFAPYILTLAKKASEDGEPMMRTLEYAYPGRGYATVADEFLMGSDLLVAPQLEKGVASRDVILPPGRWRADDGKVFEGPATISVATPLDRLPHFERRP